MMVKMCTGRANGVEGFRTWCCIVSLQTVPFGNKTSLKLNSLIASAYPQHYKLVPQCAQSNGKAFFIQSEILQGFFSSFRFPKNSQIF